MDRWHATRRLR